MIETGTTGTEGTRKDGAARPAWLAAVLIGAYAATIAIPGNVLVSADVRLMIYNYRPYVVGGVIATALLLLVAWRSPRITAVLGNPGRVGVLGLSLLFPAYYTFAAALKGRFSLPVVALYWLWSLTAFLLIPAFVHKAKDLRRLLLAVALGCACTLLLALALSLILDIRDIIPWIRGGTSARLLGEQAPLGWLNGNYYSQLPQVLCFVLVFALLVDGERPVGPRMRQLLWIAVAGAFMLVVAAVARNVVLAIVVFFASLLALRRGAAISRMARLTMGAAIVVGVLAVVLLSSEYEEVNRVTTGRLEFWSFLYEAILDGDRPAMDLLFGPDALPSYGAIKAYDPLVAEKAFTKLHVDNFYLELIIESGVVGLALFLLPYLELTIRLIRQLSSGELAARLGAWGLAVTAAVAVQGMFIPTFPSFNNPAGFFIVVAVSVATLSGMAPEPAVDLIRSPGRGAPRGLTRRG